MKAIDSAVVVVHWGCTFTFTSIAYYFCVRVCLSGTNLEAVTSGTCSITSSRAVVGGSREWKSERDNILQYQFGNLQRGESY